MNESRITLRWLLALALLLGGEALPARAASRTYFVSNHGADHASGERAAPLKTIAAALKKVPPGGRVVVLPGTYLGTVTLPKSGAEGHPITFAAEGKVVLDPRKNKRDHGHGIVGRGVGYWIIEGFEIIGGEQGIKFKDGHDIVVRKCKLHGGDTGVALEGKFARTMRFEDIEVYENRSGGFDVSNPVALEDVTFLRCQAHHNDCQGGADGFGISHHCTTRNVRFEQCVAHHNGSDGFDLSGKKGFGVTVVGCVAHHNGQKMWGCNFKCWNPGSVFINCTAWATGKTADANFGAYNNNITFLNCTSGSNADAGFSVSGQGARLINCILAYSKKTPLRVSRKNPKASATAEHCLVFQCGETGLVKIGQKGNVEGDPKFVNAAKGDYRIANDGAAAGKGQTLKRVKTDQAGQPRPQNAPAIGAFEPQGAGK